jgi:hypothetical protein
MLHQDALLILKKTFASIKFCHVNTTKQEKKEEGTRCTVSSLRMIARQGYCLTVRPHGTKPRQYIYHLEVLRRGLSSAFPNGLLLDGLLKGTLWRGPPRLSRESYEIALHPRRDYT